MQKHNAQIHMLFHRHEEQWRIDLPQLDDSLPSSAGYGPSLGDVCQPLRTDIADWIQLMAYLRTPACYSWQRNQRLGFFAKGFECGDAVPEIVGQIRLVHGGLRLGKCLASCRFVAQSPLRHC